MTKLMVDGLHPHPLAIVNSAAFPVLGMNQMDATVLEGSPSSPTRVDILEPLYMRPLDSVKAAKVRNCPSKHRWAMILEI
jgi:hypothetical protein